MNATTVQEGPTVAEGITTLRRERPRRMKRMVPRHTWQLVEPYGLARRMASRRMRRGG
jgi:hypothetical protein